MWQRFILYGLLGWITELIWTGLGSLMTGDLTLSGHSYLWMFPIYGCAVLFEPVHNNIREYRWFMRGIINMGIRIWFWLVYRTADWDDSLELCSQNPIPDRWVDKAGLCSRLVCCGVIV